MEDFAEEVDDIRSDIEKIEQNVEQLKDIHTKMLSQKMPDNCTKELVDDLIGEIGAVAACVLSRLKDMSLQSVEPTAGVSVQSRIRRTQISMLLNMLSRVMSDYNREQMEHMQRCKTLMLKNLESDRSQMTADMLEALISGGHMQVLYDKYEDIMRAERSIRELHQVYLDMADMVDEQGDLHDNIEHGVGRVEGEAADKILVKCQPVKGRQNSAAVNERKQFFVFLILFVVMLILVIVGIIYLD